MSTPHTVDCKINMGDILLLQAILYRLLWLLWLWWEGEGMFLGGISLLSLQYGLLS